MKALADKIRSTGRKAGLWLAPLIAVRSSALFREHPDWFLRDKMGKFISAGHNWGEQLFALDTTHPDVLIWLVSLMDQIRKWGFEYVKLDFLYGGALPGRRFNFLPRESAYRAGLKVIREALGNDIFFLACGAPILPSLGLCDALRIGPDVAGEWENKRDAVLLYNPAIPGTRNAIRTSIHRKWLAPLVQTDPDVVYFRSADFALVCNIKATSDLPGLLGADERESLRAFLNLKPVIDQVSRYVYKVDDRIVDFSPAISLPGTPGGFDLIQGIIMAWLGDQGWALNFLDKLHQNSLKKLVKELKSS
jgi:alpha-galactosidase